MLPNPTLKSFVSSIPSAYSLQQNSAKSIMDLLPPPPKPTKLREYKHIKAVLAMLKESQPYSCGSDPIPILAGESYK